MNAPSSPVAAPLRTSSPEEMPTRLDAMVFDFDGLICDTEGVLVRTAQEIFEAHGATLPIDRWLTVVGTHSPAEFWVPWLQEQVDYEINTAEVLAEFQDRNHGNVLALDPNDGVIELLTLLTESGFPIAIASSSPISWVEPLTENLGLRPFFSHVVCREHAERAKPAPDLYLEACRRMNVDPMACVAFEDSHNGSLAAIRAGMYCVAAPNELTRVQDFSHVHAVVESLAHIDTVARLLDLVVS